MYSITARQLVSVWEQGLGQSPGRRALSLLAMARGLKAEELYGLTVGQRDSALMDMRAKFFGAHFSAMAACPVCREKVEVAFHACDLPSFSPANAADISILNSADYEIRFRLPVCGDLEALRPDSPENMGRNLLRRCLLSARKQGRDLAWDELPEIVMDALDRKMEALDPWADLNLALSCPVCGHAWAMGFDITQFLWSEISMAAHRLFSEVHLLASAYGWDEDRIFDLSPVRLRMYLQRIQA